MNVSDVLRAIHDYPAEPLPLFADEATLGIWFSPGFAFFSWSKVPAEAVEAFAAGRDVYVITLGGKWLWLRNPVDMGGRFKGRVIEIAPEDYIYHSISAAPSQKTCRKERAPVVTQMEAGICTECYFSNAPCGTHKV